MRIPAWDYTRKLYIQAVMAATAASKLDLNLRDELIARARVARDNLDQMKRQDLSGSGT